MRILWIFLCHICHVLQEYTILSAVYSCYVNFVRKDVRDGVHLFCQPNIHICCELFSGICLNSLVIVSFWRSVQLGSVERSCVI